MADQWERGVMSWNGLHSKVYEMRPSWPRVVGNQDGFGKSRAYINGDSFIIFRTSGRAHREQGAELNHYAYFDYNSKQYYFQVPNGPLPKDIALQFEHFWVPGVYPPDEQDQSNPNYWGKPDPEPRIEQHVLQELTIIIESLARANLALTRLKNFLEAR